MAAAKGAVDKESKSISKTAANQRSHKHLFRQTHSCFRETPLFEVLDPLEYVSIGYLLFNALTIRVADDARADDPLQDDASNAKYPVINLSRVRISISFLPCATVGSSSIMATMRGTIQELASLVPKWC